MVQFTLGSPSRPHAIIWDLQSFFEAHNCVDVVSVCYLVPDVEIFFRHAKALKVGKILNIWKEWTTEFSLTVFAKFQKESWSDKKEVSIRFENLPSDSKY